MKKSITTKSVKGKGDTSKFDKLARQFIRDRNTPTTTDAEALDIFVAGVVSTILRRESVKQFRQDEAENGTRVALQNLVWLLASDLLHEIGVKRVRTSYKTSK
jgi:hypothetical protein